MPSQPMASTYPRPRSIGPQLGQPVGYTSGFLAGRTVRVELEEIQAADVGRKYARKDKRPLDPPPVVLCRFVEILRSSNGFGAYERELDSESATLGAFCHVDLFPVPEECRASELAPETGALASVPPQIRPASTTGVLPSLSSMHIRSESTLQPTQVLTDPALELLPAALQVSSLPTSLAPLLHPPVQSPLSAAPSHALLGHSANPPSIQSIAKALELAAGVSDPDIVASFGPYPIRESSRCTTMLAGGAVVQAENVDYDGHRAVMFVFSDLAVKSEGTFVLRYRAGSVFSQCGTPPHSPILAECYGRPFRVYATKNFPGLGPSTSLTKHLSQQNVRVLLRHGDRKRGRESAGSSSTPDGSGASGTGGGEGDTSTLRSTSDRSRRSTSTLSGRRKHAFSLQRGIGAGGSRSRASGEDGGGDVRVRSPARQTPGCDIQG